MLLFYNLGIRLYYLFALIVSAWNPKARLWIAGRRNWERKLEGVFSRNDQVAWFHCASLGEFEQGRPIIEAYRERCPGHKILLSFFSPSGFEKRKDYKGADHVIYLPLDTARNARRLLKIVPLRHVVFIKYEFWYHILRALHKQNIPVYLASGIFRSGQVFFRWYGGWYRRFLSFFTHIFVQQESSATLLAQHGIQHVSVAGDTRFDRVDQLARTPYDNEVLEDFTRGKRVIVAGSTWPPDENLLHEAYAELPDDLLWIIAPHELSESHIGSLKKNYPSNVLFTELDAGIPEGTRVLIVDTIGQLSYLYRYATLAYIGGGFGKGIHNTLEAATYGLPVIFGPKYGKFSEALELIERKAAFSITNKAELLFTIRQQLEMNSLLKNASFSAQEYVKEKIGASRLILDKLCIS